MVGVPRCHRLFPAVLLVVGAGASLARTSPVLAATTVSDCPTTESALQSDINSAGAGGTLDFDCSSATTITFTSPIEIGQDVTLDASNSPASVTFDGNHATQFFFVDAGSSLTLNTLTLENGHDTNGTAAVDNLGTLTITGSTLSGNSPICINFGCTVQGGAIDNSGTLTLTSSTLSGNSPSCTSSASGCFVYGGAIYNSGSLTLTRSTLSGNSPTCTASSESNCTVYGGAIYNKDALTIATSTLSGNSPTCSASVGTACGINGGAIYNDMGGTLTITNSTLSGDAPACTAPSGSFCGVSGGAIYNYVTSLTLGATIIAGNTSNGSSDNCLNAGTVVDWGYNLTDDDGTGCGLSTASHDQLNTNPDLGPLYNNGGPTYTMALQLGSPAIDYIPVGVAHSLCPASGGADQRGYPRPDGNEAKCDIGAYEYQDLATALSVQPASGVYGGTTTLSATLTDSSETGIPDETITFYLNGSAVCGGTSQPTCPTTADGTNGTTLGQVTLPNVSLTGINAGTYPSSGSCNAGAASDGVFASFAGDSTYGSSSGCNTLTVNAVTPSLSSTPNPSSTTVGASHLGDSATLSSGVNASGTLTFYLFAPGVTPNGTNSNNVYSDRVTVNGNGTYDTRTGTNPGGYFPTATGTYQWVAVYSGDTNNNGVTSTFGDEPVTVSPADTTTTLSSSPNPSTSGQSVTFTATITVSPPGSGTPTGTVEFQDNGSDITNCGSQMVSTSNNTTTATCQTSALSPGVHTVSALYSGDGNFLGSSGTLDQDVSYTVPNGKSAYDIESANWYCISGGITCIPSTGPDAGQCVTMAPCPGASYGVVEAFGPPSNSSTGIPDELILACVHGTSTGYQIGYLDVLSSQGNTDYPGGIYGAADPGVISGKGTVIGGGEAEDNASQPSSISASAYDITTGIVGSVTGIQNTDNTGDTLNSGSFRVTIRGRLWTVNTTGTTPVTTRSTTSSTISCTIGGLHGNDLRTAGIDTDALAEGELENSLGDNQFLPIFAPRSVSG